LEVFVSRLLPASELAAPGGKFRIIQIDENGKQIVERDLGSLEESIRYVEMFPQWGWEVRNDKGEIVHSVDSPIHPPVVRQIFYE
jgi:hypothetical protein